MIQMSFKEAMAEHAANVKKMLKEQRVKAAEERDKANAAMTTLLTQMIEKESAECRKTAIAVTSLVAKVDKLSLLLGGGVPDAELKEKVTGKPVDKGPEKATDKGQKDKKTAVAPPQQQQQQQDPSAVGGLLIENLTKAEWTKTHTK